MPNLWDFHTLWRLQAPVCNGKLNCPLLDQFLPFRRKSSTCASFPNALRCTYYIKRLLKSRSCDSLMSSSCTRLLSSKPSVAVKNDNEIKQESVNVEEGLFADSEGKELMVKKDVTIAPVKSLKKKANVIITNFFLGKFDKEWMIFPELPNNDQLNSLKDFVQPIQHFFDQSVDSRKIDRECIIPNDIMHQLKNLGLFGLKIPKAYGGIGLNNLECARVEEVTGLDGSISALLNAHNSWAVRAILLGGSAELKASYLPDMASGSKIGALCLSEEYSGSDISQIEANAVLSQDSKHFLLSGQKTWITSADLADVFVVFANVIINNPLGVETCKLTAFLVEKGFGGITMSDPVDKMGLRASNICHLTFDKTPVPVENVISEIGDGFNLALRVVNDDQHLIGSRAAGILKKLIVHMTNHLNSRKQFGQELRNYGMIQEKLAKMACSVYAMESMAYYTAGMLDNYECPDISLEAAATKAFSNRELLAQLSEAMQLMGAIGFSKNEPFEVALRDARANLLTGRTDEMLYLYISIQSLQETGKQLATVIKKSLSPLDNPLFIVKSALRRLQGSMTQPILDHKIYDQVHPSMGLESEEFEKLLIRFHWAVENNLRNHGPELIDNHILCRYLAEIAIELFAMMTIIARATRSVSIGLQESRQEMHIVRCHFYTACKRVAQLLDEVEASDDPGSNNLENIRHVAECIYKESGYKVTHALERNW